MNRKKIVASLLFAILCGNFITLMAQNKMDAQGRRQGKWVKVDKNNRKIYEGNFVDGYEVGLFTYYYSDGTVRIKNNFWDKGKMCSHEAYDAKGNLMAKGFYNQKNKDSVWHLYNDKGILLKTISYKMGTKTGPSVLLDKTGDTLEVQTWNDDKKHGKWYRRLSNNGYITAEYADDVLNGKYAEYRNDKVVTEGSYDKGLRAGTWKYYRDSNLEIVEKWAVGNLRERVVLLYSENPQMISIDDIAYFFPKGPNNTIVITMSGDTIVDKENVQYLYERVGHDHFVTINKEKQFVAAYRCILGLGKDEEGNEYLDLEPKLSFNIYPDADCKKLVQSMMREGLE
jgi:antitoxin component YwqK of YwqJK toxin-antitoxin module